jgi:hypothetical protein
MKLMLQAISYPNGDLVLCGDAKALLFRAIADIRTHLDSEPAREHAELTRTLDMLGRVLGRYEEPLPTAMELLGDPERERIARNLLKG